MQAGMRAIEYFLPENVLTNNQLAADFPEWTAEKIEEKTGIANRHIASSDQCASDLSVAAAQKLFASGVCSPTDIDYLLLCTQSPDYFLPTTACIMQQRLGIPQSAGALDFNLGCSGYVFGLGLAKGLIESGQAKNVLLVTAETYSKYMHPEDKSVRTLFGDGAAVTLIQALEDSHIENPWIGPFVYGTDGQGALNLIVPVGGLRNPKTSATAEPVKDAQGNVRSSENLFMNGPEIFAFTLRVVPQAVNALLERARITLNDIDLFVFHQANRYMLDHLRKKVNIPLEKFVIALRESGNTVSATIPIALKEVLLQGKLRPGARVMLVGFGVGYSWGAVLVRWHG